MSLVAINRHPSRRDLFWFGGLLPVFFGAVGGLLWWKYSAIRASYVVWSSGAVLSLAYGLMPASRRFVYLGWMYAAMPLAAAISCVVLVAIFYVVITPCGAMMRLCRYDPLRRKFDRRAKTYWLPREPSQALERYLRQS